MSVTTIGNNSYLGTDKEREYYKLHPDQLTYSAFNSLVKAVDAGIEELNARCHDWHWRIDLYRLDISNSCDCITGQLKIPDLNYWGKLGLQRELGFDLPQEPCYGWVKDGPNNNALRQNAWNLLQDIWVDRINQRRKSHPKTA